MQRLLSRRVIEAHWKRQILRAWVTFPTMWCLVVDQLLHELSKVGIFARAYADDVIIICRADDKEVLFSLMRFALGMVEKWCYKVKLSVNPNEAVFFTSRYKVDSLRKLTMYGREITVVKEAKYLGIMLDSRLAAKVTWKLHARKPRNPTGLASEGLWENLGTGTRECEMALYFGAATTLLKKVDCFGYKK